MRGSPRPEKRIRTLQDLVEGSKSVFEGGKQGAWVKGGESVKAVVMDVREGLLAKLAGHEEGMVVVLLDNPTGESPLPSPLPVAIDDDAHVAAAEPDALLVTLALALTSSHKPIVLRAGDKVPASLAFVAVVHSANHLSVAQNLAASSAARLISVGGEDDDSEGLVLLGKDLAEERLRSEVKKSSESDPTSSGDEPNALALTIVVDGVGVALTHLVSIFVRPVVSCA